MALAAISISGYMIGRFTRGGYAIVTGCAVTHDAYMIITGADKGSGVMAYGTVQCGGYMIHWFASGRCSIVARRTVIYDSRVIEHGC